MPVTNTVSYHADRAQPTLMRPYAAAQLIGKVKNATPGMVIATMAHGIEAAIEAAVSTETDATDIMGETH